MAMPCPVAPPFEGRGHDWTSAVQDSAARNAQACETAPHGMSEAAVVGPLGGLKPNLTPAPPLLILLTVPQATRPLRNSVRTLPPFQPR